jgi:hypothetical protein
MSHCKTDPKQTALSCGQEPKTNIYINNACFKPYSNNKIQIPYHTHNLRQVFHSVFWIRITLMEIRILLVNLRLQIRTLKNCSNRLIQYTYTGKWTVPK